MIRRFYALSLLLALSTSFSACRNVELGEPEGPGERSEPGEPAEPGEPGEVPERETLGDELAESRRTTNPLMVFGQDYAARPAPTLEETRATLYDDRGNPGPTLLALLASGMDEEEAVETVFAVAGHNSGQPYDPVRQRADEWREVYQGAVDTFTEELEEASEENGVVIDRQELLDNGVVLGWEDVR